MLWIVLKIVIAVRVYSQYGQDSVQIVGCGKR
jgi:hypothetical protein